MDIVYVVAISVTIVLTILICVIEIVWQSKTTEYLLAVSHTSFFFYLLIALVGNGITTFVATSVVRNIFAQKPAEVPNPSTAKENKPPSTAEALSQAGLPLYVKGFFASFLGVFAFKVFLEQINVTFAGRGVLTIEEWITKARDAAEAGTIAHAVSVKIKRTVQLGQKIDANQKQTDQMLNTYADSWLGAGSANKLNQQAAANGGNGRLLISLALADGAYDRAVHLV